MKIEYLLLEFPLHVTSDGFQCTASKRWTDKWLLNAHFERNFYWWRVWWFALQTFFSQYEQKFLMNENKRKLWKLDEDFPRKLPLQCYVVFLKTYTHSKYLNCEFELLKLHSKNLSYANLNETAWLEKPTRMQRKPPVEMRLLGLPLAEIINQLSLV